MTPDDLQRTVLGARPDLAALPVTVLTDSWDSTALDFGDRVICKFPRTDRALAALRREVQVLAALNGRVRLPVPQMVLHPGPPVFSVHPKLPGVALTAEVYATLPDAARQGVGQALGQFYADLHAVADDVARAAGAADIGTWLPVDQLRRVAVPLLPGALQDLARRALDAWTALPADPFGATYGFFDGHGWNMAFDPVTRRLNGVFDFADSGLGPLHQDFVYSNFIDPDLTDCIVASYAQETGRALDPARIDLLTSVFRLSELAAATVGDDRAHRAQMLENACGWFTSGRRVCG